MPKQSHAIPGYAGYRPRIAADNDHIGKTFTEQSREVFREEKIDTHQNMLASTGFNHALINKKDDTLHATTSRHGCSTMQRTAKSM